MRRGWLVVALSVGCNEHRYGALPGVEDATTTGVTASEGDDDGTPPPATPGVVTSVPEPGASTSARDPTVGPPGEPDPTGAGGCGEVVLPAVVPIEAIGDTATAGDRFAPSCGAGVAPEAVFVWTAPFTGNFRFDSGATAFGTRVAVLGGVCGGAELACAEQPEGARVDVELTAGESVTVVVEGTGQVVGAVVLTISEAPLTCTAANIGAQLGTLPGDTEFAMSQWSGPCGGFMAREAVFRWTPPFAGEFRFETLSAEFVPVLYLRRDCGDVDLACAGAVDGEQARVQAALDPVDGDVLVFVDAAVPGTGGAFVLQIAEAL